METDMPEPAGRFDAAPSETAQDRPTKMRKLVHEGANEVGGSETTQAPHSNSAAAAESSGPGLSPPSVKASHANDQVDIPSENDTDPETTPGPSSSTQNSRQSAIAVLEAAGIPLVDEEGKPLTKSAMKRIRRKIEWDAKADERRIRRREEAKRKKERKRAEKNERTISQVGSGETKGGEAGKMGSTVTPPPAQRPPAVQVPITIIIDCSYNHLMTDRELKSLAGQITRCYSDNQRTSQYRVHLAISSWSGVLKSRFENELDRQHENWKGVRFFEEDFAEVAKLSKEWMRGPEGGQLAGALSDDFVPLQSSMVPREVAEKKLDDPEGALEETVYFSSDSSRTLARLQPYGTYVIGGLVDRNRHKGVCHRSAVAKGMATAQLPIGEFLKLSAVNVLATNHVNEIALRWLEMGNWADAFLRVMPKRKGGQLLDHWSEKGAGEESAQEAVDSGDGKEAGDEVKGEAETVTEERDVTTEEGLQSPNTSLQ